ncbi:MAG: hypothetical protein ABL971_04930 [Vicinamibacterales bacterium]
MNIESLGHAGLLLRDDAGAPILVTDPWVLGSCYWRSWWLVNYPSPALRAEVARARYGYITHEHPDHFHTASIRALGTSIEYLAPDLPQEHITGYLREQGYQASVLPAFTWKTLAPGVRVLSIPLLNDDSVLIVDTPAAVAIDLNDSKPSRGQIRQLRGWLDRHAPGKRRILLSSYSPASIVNSFIRHTERVTLRQKSDYVHNVCDNCRTLGVDDFIPFASQVIFRRRDSVWANAFKVSFDDLRTHWRAPETRLLPPYTRIDLRDGAVSSVPPEAYNTAESDAQRKVEAQESLDATADLEDEHLEKLRRKLNASRWILAALFPRGVGFALEHTHLHYSPWSGRLLRGRSHGDFTLVVPAQAFKDAVTYGHLGDMGTAMFTMVMLNSGIDPRRVYLFFLVVTLNDYGHTGSFSRRFRWLRNTIRIHRWRLPAPSAAEVASGG